MNRKLIISLTVIGSIALTAGIVNAAATHNVTNTFGPDGDIYQVNGTMKMRSVMIGEQDVGGVTYFNGSIVNSTTNNSVDNPVTFGDNVRIDGRVWRGAEAGTADTMPFIVNDNMEVTGSLEVANLIGTGVVNSNNIMDNSITTSDLTDDVISGAKIADGSVGSADITDGTIATADIADDAVTPAKINGTGGANLPIAYGWCNDDGTTRGGTSNVTCSWDAGASQYEIDIAGVDYDYREKIAVVTPVDEGMIAAISSVSGDFVVTFTTHAGVADQQADFNFIIYNM